MNLEAQRIAIAEAYGYTNVHKFNKWKEGGPMADGVLIGNRDGLTRRYIPNYLGCLNAMHEVEISISDKGAYLRVLKEIVYKAYTINPKDETDGWDVLATAGQRAEAFLKTLGLWKD